ncbi:MAG: hypothetical protein C0434_06795 [Xanthomonadaceae bacterium]|nr:hypothetical protein [Xanthomonadaceae bacterium]
MSADVLVADLEGVGRSARGGVLALGAFALIASAFMPVSLLPPIAADLRSSEGMAGQALAVTGAFALIASLCVSTLTRRLDRKLLLPGLTLLMVLSRTIVALAPNAVVFMIDRALIGAVIRRDLHRTLQIMSLIVAALAAALVLCPRVGGVLYDALGDQATFAISALLLVAAAGVAVRVARFGSPAPP